MINKKGLAYSAIIGIILAVVTFIVLFTPIKNYFADYSYGSSLLQCNQFIMSVDGGAIYFKNGDTITTKFEQSIANFCSAKTVEIDKNSVYDAVKLTSDCWNKFGEGEDFLGANVGPDEAFCFYCGKLIVDDEVDSFKEDFISIAKKNEIYFNQTDRETININFQILDSTLPEKLDETQYIFYVVKKGSKQSNADYFQTLLSKGLISFGGWTGFGTEFISSSDIDTNTGVFYTTNNFSDLTKNKCHTIIPIKEYE